MCAFGSQLHLTLGAYLTHRETGTGRDYLRKLLDSGRGRLDQEVQPIESEPRHRHQETVEERVRLESGPAKRRVVKPESSGKDPPTGVPTPHPWYGKEYHRWQE